VARGGHSRWKPGESGNPSGRRTGTVLAQTQVRKMIEEASVDIIRRQIELAREGNPFIAKFLIERVLPAARSAPINAPVQIEGTPVQQAERVTELLAGGEITLEEGAALLSAIAATQNIREATELAQRVDEIEAKLAALTSGSPVKESGGGDA
jgi:Family of unknown function (DUF5681)